MSAKQYCMSCGFDDLPVVLGRCENCWGERPFETFLGDMAKLARDLEKAREKENDAMVLATQRAEKIEELRTHARRLCHALRNLHDELNDAPLEKRRAAWEAALAEAGVVLQELEPLYGE